MENIKMRNDIRELKKCMGRMSTAIKDMEAYANNSEYRQDFSMEELKELLNGKVVSGTLDDYLGVSVRMKDANMFVDSIHGNIVIHDEASSINISISESYIQDIYEDKGSIVIDLDRNDFDSKLVLKIKNKERKE